MPDPNPSLPRRFLRTQEAARHLGVSPRTLEKHRIYGTGPTYRKIGGRVVAQRLTLHPGQPRRLRPAHPLQGVGNGEHPTRRRAIRLAPHQPAKRVRRQVIADRQASRTHRVLLAGQTQTESDHDEPAYITSESATALGGIRGRAPC